MGYYIDLSKITIEEYQLKLQKEYLPPSRMILKENESKELIHFKQMGIKNIEELLQILKNKKKFSEIVNEKKIPENYLVILLRELKSMLPKPEKLSDFKSISQETVKKLEEQKIKNTVKLFDKILTPESRKKLATELNITIEEVTILAKLTDLSRVKWVGATFAEMLLYIKVDTVEKLSNSTPETLHKQVNQHNKEKEIYKGQIGLNDIRIVIEIAKELSLDIVY